MHIMKMFKGSDVDLYKIMSIMEARKEDKDLTPKIARAMFASVDLGFKKTDIKLINVTAGNIRKYEYYPLLKETIKSLQKFVDSMKDGDDYLNIIKNQMAFMENNSASLAGGFKRNNKFVKYLYVSTVISITELCNIMISAVVQNITRGIGISKYIQGVKQYKETFEEATTIFNAENSKILAKMIKRKHTPILETVEGEETEVLESSISYFMDIIAMGASMLLFHCLGFVRAIIYGVFFFKERIKEGNERMKEFVEYANTQDSDKADQLETKLSRNKDYQIKALKADSDAEKEIKIQAIDSNQILL